MWQVNPTVVVCTLHYCIFGGKSLLYTCVMSCYLIQAVGRSLKWDRRLVYNTQSSGERARASERNMIDFLKFLSLPPKTCVIWYGFPLKPLRGAPDSWAQIGVYYAYDTYVQKRGNWPCTSEYTHVCTKSRSGEWDKLVKEDWANTHQKVLVCHTRTQTRRTVQWLFM